MKNKKNIMVILMALPFLSMGALRAKEMVTQYQENEAAQQAESVDETSLSPAKHSQAAESPSKATKFVETQPLEAAQHPTAPPEAQKPVEQSVLDKRADAIRQTQARMLAQATLAETKGDMELAERLRTHAARLEEGLKSANGLRLAPSPDSPEVSHYDQ